MVLPLTVRIVAIGRRAVGLDGRGAGRTGQGQGQGQAGGGAGTVGGRDANQRSGGAAERHRAEVIAVVPPAAPLVMTLLVAVALV